MRLPDSAALDERVRGKSLPTRRSSVRRRRCSQVVSATSVEERGSWGSARDHGEADADDQAGPMNAAGRLATTRINATPRTNSEGNCT
jgi:hypothetical protein